jgi:hypothetical protein
VRSENCGIVLPHYSAESVRGALVEMGDTARRKMLAENAGRYGRTAMNWSKGEEILRREYSALLPRRPESTLGTLG